MKNGIPGQSHSSTNSYSAKEINVCQSLFSHYFNRIFWEKILQKINMDLTKQKILVTGTDGFIGSHLVEGLLDKGCQVRAFVLG